MARPLKYMTEAGSLYDELTPRLINRAYKAGVAAGRREQRAAEERQTARNRTDRMRSAMLARQGRVIAPPVPNWV